MSRNGSNSSSSPGSEGAKGTTGTVDDYNDISFLIANDKRYRMALEELAGQFIQVKNDTELKKCHMASIWLGDNASSVDLYANIEHKCLPDPETLGADLGFNELLQRIISHVKYFLRVLIRAKDVEASKCEDVEISTEIAQVFNETGGNIRLLLNNLESLGRERGLVMEEDHEEIDGELIDKLNDKRNCRYVWMYILLNQLTQYSDACASLLQNHLE